MRHVRSLLALTIVTVLMACNSMQGTTKPVVVGPDPQAGQGFRFIGHISGDFDGQGFAYANPITSLVKAHGDMMVTIRAFPAPFLVIDGDGSLVVEPIPGREQEAIQAVQNGDILIRRNGLSAGLSGALNPVGSISAYKAMLMRQATRSPAMPSPSPATEPKTSGSLPSPSPATVAVASVPDDPHSDGCSGPGSACGMPATSR